jgi:hypothetical protein
MSVYRVSRSAVLFVMPGLVPGIRAFSNKPWMAGSSPV